MRYETNVVGHGPGPDLRAARQRLVGCCHSLAPISTCQSQESRILVRLSSDDKVLVLVLFTNIKPRPDRPFLLCVLYSCTSGRQDRQHWILV